MNEKYRHQALKTPPRVVAGWDGYCGECGLEIESGDNIGYYEPEAHWFHYGCLLDLLDLEA